MMRYPEIYYSDEVKRILNSKPPLPEKPKEPRKVTMPSIPSEKGDSLGCAIVVLVVSIVLFIVGAMTKTFQLSMVCSFIMIISFFVVGIATNRKRAYEDDLRQYYNAQAKQKEYTKQYAEYQKQLGKYQENIKDMTSEANLQTYRQKAILSFLSNRTTPVFSDCDTENVKKGISEDYFAKELSKEFDVLTNQKVEIDETYFYYPDILLIHNNIYIDIEIDEPYSIDDEIPIHYIDKGGYSVDKDRNDDFTSEGFEIIRFSEEQIYRNPDECITVIKKFLNSFETADYKNITDPKTFSMPKWTKDDAIKMAFKKYRNCYLNHPEQQIDFPIQINEDEQNAFKQYIKNQDAKDAMKFLTKYAEKGSPLAQFWLGAYFFVGRGVPKNLANAVELFTKSAEQNNIVSLSWLGVCYYYGSGVSINYKKAYECFIKVVEVENYDVYRRRSYIMRIYIIAQCMLGNCYYFGNGVSQNYTQAVEWYKKAMEYRIPNKYDGNYKRDDNPPKDLIKMYDWHIVQIKSKMGMAQNNLAVCYSKGLGVQKDPKIAIECYRKSADNNNAKAQYALGLYYFKGNEVNQDYKKSVEFFLKSAQKGHAYAQYYLGECYFNGYGVLQDYQKAVEWYSKSVEQDNASAQFALGNCYYKGNGVSIDREKAIELFKHSAENGNSKAQCNFGYLYYKGIGLEQNYSQAVEWYTKSASQGNDKAQYYLGNCYYNGEGVVKDLTKAMNWHTKAAKQGNSQAQKMLEKIKHDNAISMILSTLINYTIKQK